MNAALVGFCALAYWWRRKRSVEVLGFFWILVAYAPSWIIPNSDLFSESRLYLPFAGFSLVVTSPLVGRGDLKSWCWRACGATLLLTLLTVPLLKYGFSGSTGGFWGKYCNVCRGGL